MITRRSALTWLVCVFGALIAGGFVSLGRSASTHRQRAETVRFAAIGDFGNNSAAEGDVASRVASWDVDFVITLGDNRYSDWTYDEVIGQYYCQFLTDAGSGTYCTGSSLPTNAFFPAAGNHDYSDGAGIDEYLGYFTLPGSGITTSGTSASERYYDFTEGPVQFFVLDSHAALNDSAEMAAQKVWLEQAMAASTTAWQIVYFHHAAYSSASHGSNSAMQWPFAAWGADVVISGHDHTYERIARDGILYFVNGAGGRDLYSFGSPIPGSQFRYNGDHGAMLIEASDDVMAFQFINHEGTLIDSFSTVPSMSISQDVQIDRGADDVEEQISSGEMYSNSTDLELGSDVAGVNGPQLVGLRFNQIDLPAGATIVDAYLEFETDESTTTATQVLIQAEATGYAAPFTSADHNLSLRPRTVQSVTWHIPPWDTTSERHHSPDLSAILQEIVDRGDWLPFNSVVMIVAGDGRRIAESYEGEPDAAPILHIEYRILSPFQLFLPLLIWD
jgi:hypothetical protein